MPSKWDAVNRAKGRQRKGELNKTEKAWARVLEGRRVRGEIQGWLSQTASWELAKGVHYRPDFLVVELDGQLVFHEVKGSRGFKLDPQGRVKLKVAADKFPFLTWVGVVKRKKGGWDVEEINPRPAWPPVLPD